MSVLVFCVNEEFIFHGKGWKVVRRVEKHFCQNLNLTPVVTIFTRKRSRYDQKNLFKVEGQKIYVLRVRWSVDWLVGWLVGRLIE